MLNWFLECLLQDLLIDYFDDEFEVFYNFLVVLINLFLLFVVLLHLLVMLFLCFILLLAFGFLLFLGKWLGSTSVLWFFGLVLSLIKRVRPPVFKFLLINVVLNLHLDLIIELQVVEDLSK